MKTTLADMNESLNAKMFRVYNTEALVSAFNETVDEFNAKKLQLIYVEELIEELQKYKNLLK